MSRSKLQKLLNKLDGKNEATMKVIADFDVSVKTLRDKLEQDISVATLEEVNGRIAKLKKLINFEPLLAQVNDLQIGFKENALATLKEIEDKTNQLQIVINEGDAKLKIKTDKIEKKGEVLAGQFNILAKGSTENLLKINKTVSTIVEKLPTFADKKETEKKITELENRDNTKELKEYTDKTKIDLLSRLSEKGGGGMNQQIRVEGSVLTKYADINFYGTSSSVVSSIDNTNKRINIGIGGGAAATLQNAYEGGNTITKNATRNAPIIIADAATYTTDLLQLNVSQGGNAIKIVTDTTSTGIDIDNTLSTGAGLTINAALGAAFVIKSSGTTKWTIDQAGVWTGTNNATVVASYSSTGNFMLVTNTSTGIGLAVNNTSTGQGMLLYGTGTGDKLRITGTVGGISLRMRNAALADVWSWAGAGALTISQNATITTTYSTTASFLNITNSSSGNAISITNSGTGVAYFANGTSTGNNLQFQASGTNNFVVSSAGLLTVGTFDTRDSTGVRVALANSSITNTAFGWASFGSAGTPTGTNNSAFGNGALNGITTGIQNTAIGASALGVLTDGTGNTAVGYQALNAQAGGVISNNSAFGFAAGHENTIGYDNVYFGLQAGYWNLSGIRNVYVGRNGGLQSLGNGNVVIGYQAGRITAGTFNYSIAFGYEAVYTASNQLVIGGGTNDGGDGNGFINDVYIGSGVIGSSPTSVTLNATGGSGTNIAGANLTLAGGKGTGNALNGNILLQVSTAGASGTTLQSLATIATVNRFGMGIGAAPATGTILLLSQTDATGNPAVVQNINLDTSANSYAIYTMYAGTSATGGMFFGSKAALAGYGIANGISFRVAGSAQDIGFTAGYVAGSTDPQLLVSNDGNIKIAPSTSTNVRHAIDYNVGGWGFGDPAAGNSTSLGDKLMFLKAAASNMAIGINGNQRMWFQAREGVNGGFAWWSGATPTQIMLLDGAGKLGIGVTGPTAFLHLIAGTATANTAPLKFNTGSLLTTAEAGAMEFLTDAYYVTTTTGAKRRMIVAGTTGRSTGQTDAVASVATYTLGATDASYEVSANVLVTTSTTHNFTTTVAYTDESNVARTLTLSFSSLAGTFLTAITNVTGAGPYEGIPLHIRVKASTTITIATTGTFTSVTYNVEGIIKQTA